MAQKKIFSEILIESRATRSSGGKIVIRGLAFFLIFYFTFVLRAHNYDRTPGTGHLEEQMYAWAGLYLIEKGVPVAWSTLPYPQRAEIFRGKIDYFGSGPEAHVRLYKPWLDQPPLWSLISGWFAHLYKADKTQVVPSLYIRTPTVILATATGVLIFLIAGELGGYWSGLLAMFVYGTVPVFVFGSRLSVPENLIAFLFTLFVWLVIHYEAEPKFRWVMVAPILAGLAGLAKVPGYFIALFAIYFALRHKKWRHAVYVAVGVIPFVVLFFWYGTYFDAEIFRIITTVQASRPVGFASLPWIFVSPAYDIF